MGIQGLLKFIKDATEDIHIREYANQTVAVDTYCWLHRGSFACAEKLAKKEKTDQYVKYCMKYLDMLQVHKVKPILVFDGCRLPSKELVEQQRHKRRKENLEKGKQYLREGKLSQARDCFTKCISVTPAMALDVMQAARSRGIDCIVAPYEADAQLAFLSKKGIAQAIITEDSDLLCFGCNNVVFKMDVLGRGQQVKMEHLGRVKNLVGFTPELFRHMCILSGCDYLPSIKGVGLVKACKALKLSKSKDAYQVARKLNQYIKSVGPIDPSYGADFERADKTFLYQLVFDPSKRELIPLNEYPPGVTVDDLNFAGAMFNKAEAFQLAIGNVDVNTKLRIGFFDVDEWISSRKSTSPSIWSSKNNSHKAVSNADTVFIEQVSEKPTKQMNKPQKEEGLVLTAEDILEGVLKNEPDTEDFKEKKVKLKPKMEPSISLRSQIENDLINSYKPTKRNKKNIGLRRSPRKIGQIVKSRFFVPTSSSPKMKFAEVKSESENVLNGDEMFTDQETEGFSMADVTPDKVLDDILSEMSSEVGKPVDLPISPESSGLNPFSKNLNSSLKRNRSSLNSSDEGLRVFTGKKRKKIIIPNIEASPGLNEEVASLEISSGDVERTTDSINEGIPILDDKIKLTDKVNIKEETTDHQSEDLESIPILDIPRAPLSLLEDGNGSSAANKDKQVVCLSCNTDEEAFVQKVPVRKTLGIRRSVVEPKNKTVSKYFGSQKKVGLKKTNPKKSKSQKSITNFFNKS
nr:exonuclease 1 [Ciona intestinalis]|eukprot:XP_002130214.1 exonuclease 1 [Ciona intestinalis]